MLIDDPALDTSDLAEWLAACMNCEKVPMSMRILAAQELHAHRRALIRMEYIDGLSTRAMAGDARAQVEFTNLWRKPEATKTT